MVELKLETTYNTGYISSTLNRTMVELKWAKRRWEANIQFLLIVQWLN